MERKKLGAPSVEPPPKGSPGWLVPGWWSAHHSASADAGADAALDASDGGTDAP